MNHLKLAKVWLGGCSSCHLSFLNLGEWLFDLAAQFDFVYSPFMDIKEYSDGVDVALVGGAIANTDRLAMIRQVKERSRILVSFGDCAVTGNVTALCNPLGSAEPVLQRCHIEAADIHGQIPTEPGIVPPLLNRVTPVHEPTNSNTTNCR